MFAVISVGEKREHAKLIATARAPGDILTEHAAQQHRCMRELCQHARPGHTVECYDRG